jgi:hypothetical protein
MQLRHLVWLLGVPVLSAGEVTFNKDVAPILYQRCAGCHRPGDIAPMSLLSYKDSRPWAKAIREAVVSRRMPPWHADPRYGTFANDARLSTAEIDKIKAWVEAGSPEGRKEDLPPLPQFSDDWRLGKPDLVFEIPEEYQVKAGGPDINTNFRVPMNLKEDIWVEAIELRPGNRKVVHHAHVRVIPPEGLAKSPPRAEDPTGILKVGAQYTFNDEFGSHMKPEAPVIDDGCSHPGGGDYPGTDRLVGSVLASYLPGRDPDHWPKGLAKRIPAGSTLEFQIHYSPATGKPETDRTKVGFVLAKGPVKQEVLRRDLHNLFFRIPAGADNHRVTACFTLPDDIVLLSYTPHMHYRGKSQRVEVLRPGAKEPETLLSIPKYSFEWQILYAFAKPIELPKGTRIRIESTFDNSRNNPANPDPEKVIRWGSPSNEEMMDGWLEYVLPKASGTPVSQATSR